MKKLLAMLLCLAMTLVCTGILAACDGSGGGLFHQHSADTWEYDETEHWQVCADCGEILNRGAHIDDGSALCSTCTYPVHPTEGLELVSVFQLNFSNDYLADILCFLPTNGYIVMSLDKQINVTDLVIPAFYNGLPVVGIYTDVFYNNAALKSIFLPNTIEVIGRATFRDCTALEHIILPDNIKDIGEDAFENTAYYNNPNNWEQCDPWGRVLYIGNHLIEARGVTGEYAVREGTITIAAEAFYGCEGLTGITIPDGVKTIGDRAFEYCRALADISIPDSVTSIGYDVFNDTAYYKDENNWEDGALYIGNHLIDVDDDFAGAFTVRDGTMTIATGTLYGGSSNAFARCDSLASVTLPDSIKSIGPGAFYGCTSLKEINIPDSVTTIGMGAFESSALESISIPDSVTSPLLGTFYGCDSLKNVVIGNNVPYIGNQAFVFWHPLESITIGSCVMFIASCGFYSTDDLINATFVDPNGWYEVSFIDYPLNTITPVPANELSDPLSAANYLCEHLFLTKNPNIVINENM